ncbi:MAG: DUF6702 family protein [Verrucomicrobiota bacterium]
MISSRQSVLLLIAAAVAGFGLLPSLSAHEKKTALTDIFFNERSGNLEIAHRISIHDAEHVLRRTHKEPDDLVHSEKAQSRFAEYIARAFLLKKNDGSIVDLSLVGQEIESGHLWVYQEIPIEELPENAFTIQNSVFLAEVKGQINTVNVRWRSRVDTFVFTAGSETKRYEGPES